MQNIFNKHPNEHNMSYTQHFMFSMSLSIQFGVASIKACIHSFCPFLFETSSRDYSYLIYNSIDKKNIFN